MRLYPMSNSGSQNRHSSELSAQGVKELGCFTAIPINQFLRMHSRGYKPPSLLICHGGGQNGVDQR